MKKASIICLQECGPTPLSFWAHRHLDADAWVNATQFEQPLPGPVPGRGWARWAQLVVEFDGVTLRFSSSAELNHLVELLSHNALPTTRRLSELRGTTRGRNTHWLSLAEQVVSSGQATGLWPETGCLSSARASGGLGMTGNHWIRFKARPQFCGPVSVGTVEAIRVLRDGLNINLSEAKAAVDSAVFDGQVGRILANTQRQADVIARQLADSAPGVLQTWTQPQQRVDDLILVIPNRLIPNVTLLPAPGSALAAPWNGLAASGSHPPLPRARVRLYGPDTFALVVAQKLEIEIAEPDPYAVVKCPRGLLGRSVSVERLADASGFSYPCFLKPVVPKQFVARVFGSDEALQAETVGLDDATELLRSEVVSIRAEARSFVLDGVVQACAIYEGTGDVDVAAKTCERVAMALDLPRASVLDVGLLDNGEWVFIEANAAWGAGLNGCDAHQVLACIAAASKAL